MRLNLKEKPYETFALAVCLPSASCSDAFVELPYAYDEISYRRGYDLDIPLDTVVYIESQTEFDLLFAEEDTKPEANIPFSDGALAMVKGISGSGITDVQKELLQSGDRYRLSVRIYQNMTSVVETWYVAYVIPKEYVGKIDLDIEYIE